MSGWEAESIAVTLRFRSTGMKGYFSMIISAIGAVLRFLGLQNVIIIEAEHGTTQNTEAVFQELISRKSRYRIVLVSEDPSSIRGWKGKRVKILNRNESKLGWFETLQMKLFYLRACLIIDENRQLRKRDPQTVHLYLSHGSPVKSTHDYYNLRKDTDYSLCQSEFWRPIESYQLGFPEEKLIIMGFPRNDALFSPAFSMRDLFEEQYQRVVVWLPTFRQHKFTNKALGTESSGLPILHDPDSAVRINSIAAKYGVLLVVKPHPVQDLSRIEAMDLDHLKVITADFFANHGISTYEFLGKTDALITDYSSVIFDYLLTGKPIALAQEDYEEYEKKVGFAIDMDILRSCSVQLETAEDFEPFFRDLIAGDDPLREKRDELMHLANYYTDGNSTKRVVDWLEALLNNPLP